MSAREPGEPCSTSPSQPSRCVSATGLYRPHNIRVLLVGLEVWTVKDQILVSVSSDDTLTRFIKWRRDSLLKRIKHDNAQFVTGIDFLGETVGLANKFAMCAVGSGGINQDHNRDPLGLAATIAHEMGHNMGMSHDTQHCTCGLFSTNCIMTERVGDMRCGSIFCVGGNVLPVTGLKATLVMSTGICNIVGERSEEDNLSMVPTGTKCGQNKVCFDYKCQDVKVYGVSEDCSSKCSGRGVCGHRQQCHCDPGWAPPYCGTSYADLTPGRKTVIGVSVAVGVLLVLAVAFGSWIYCKKSKKTGSTCKMKTQPGQLNPLFENPRSFLKDRPQISQPTFIETTATPPCTPLTVRIAPTRPPPQVTHYCRAGSGSSNINNGWRMDVQWMVGAG